MKNLVAICISCFAVFGSASAQMDQSVAPMSQKFATYVQAGISEVKLPAFSAKDIEQFDYNDAKNGRVPHFAKNISSNITLANAGTWTSLPGGATIWRVQITVSGARGLIPLFNRLYLPPGATLHIYMPGRDETLGAFTHYNTPAPVSFCCGLIHGETCIVEYYEPALQKGKGIVSIDKVGYAYRWVAPLAKSLESGSGACEVNVKCSEGDNWTDQIQASALILVIDNTGAANCSGAMINNVRKDCTPYLISANHCTGNGVTDSEFNQWVFYFNYRGTSCSSTSAVQNQQVNGCQKMADSNDGDSATASDYLLLKLNNAPPLSFNVFYSGWDATNTIPDSGVCIGYPAADIEKISTYTTPAVSTSWANVAQNTHWQVIWSATANGHGVTEPGSSGSPLYGPGKFIVGHLTGGNSCCTADGCGANITTGPNLPDLFGKIAYDWGSCGVTSSTQLKAWLDPDNTGATTLQGMYPPCGNSLNNDAGIQAIVQPIGNVCSSGIVPVVTLRNYGGNALSSATLSYSFDNGNFASYPWSGSLLPGSTTNILLPTTTLTAGAHAFMVISSNPNGGADSNPGNDTATSSFFIANQGGSLNLLLKTDASGSKTTWQVTDATTNVVASGGPYPDLANGATYNIPLCLPVACYTFTIFSSAGNGMDSVVQGNFVLSGEAGTLIYASLTNPSFGSQEVHHFCLVPSSLGIAGPAAFLVSVVPNPSTGTFNVIAENNNLVGIRVFDVTGRMILERKTAAQNVILDLSAESRGVYILQIETESGKAVQKLVLK